MRPYAKNLLVNDKTCHNLFNYASQTVYQRAAVNNKNELIKNVRLTSFQNPQMRTVLILFKFFHPCVLVVFGCVVYTFLINVLSAYFYVALFRDTHPFLY